MIFLKFRIEKFNVKFFTDMSSIYTLLLESLYFILPAYVANMGPVIFGKLKLPFGTPINEKLFGSHKTWRGFYAGYVMAFLVLVLQYCLAGGSNGSDLLGQTGVGEFFQQYQLLDYQNINLFGYAFLFGIGAIFGDLIKSFFKRRIGIAPGKPWIPFDQLDLVIGALIFLTPFHVLPWQNILTLLIITPILHLLANVFAYKVGIKKVWW